MCSSMVTLAYVHVVNEAEMKTFSNCMHVCEYASSVHVYGMVWYGNLYNIDQHSISSKWTTAAEEK